MKQFENIITRAPFAFLAEFATALALFLVLFAILNLSGAA